MLMVALGTGIAPMRAFIEAPLPAQFFGMLGFLIQDPRWMGIGDTGNKTTKSMTTKAFGESWTWKPFWTRCHPWPNTDAFSGDGLRDEVKPSNNGWCLAKSWKKTFGFFLATLKGIFLEKVYIIVGYRFGWLGLWDDLQTFIDGYGHGPYYCYHHMLHWYLHV